MAIPYNKYQKELVESIKTDELLYSITKQCKQLNLKYAKDSCTKKQYEAIKVLRRFKWTESVIEVLD